MIINFISELIFYMALSGTIGLFVFFASSSLGIFIYFIFEKINNLFKKRKKQEI